MTPLQKASLAAYLAAGAITAGIYLWSELDKPPMLRDAFFVVIVMSSCMIVGWPIVFAGFVLTLIDETWWRS